MLTIYRLIIMPENWKAELEKMKKETEEEIEKTQEKEKELRKKYEDDKEKILDLVHSQLKPVVETFKEEGMAEIDQPKIQRYQSGISLHLPIVQQGTHIGLSMTFGLIFTDKGYALTTRKSCYDHTRDQVFSTEGYIDAPVTVEGIQNQIREFIRDRNFAVKMLEEKARRWKRFHG